MRKIKVHMHHECLTSKPSKEDVQYGIHPKITQCVSEMSTEEFAKQTVVPFSRSWIGSVISGKRRMVNFKYAHIIGVDFDDTIAFSKIKERCIKFNLLPLFAYNTFGDPNTGDDYSKFRLVFAFDFNITSKSDFDRIYKAFRIIFPELDKQSMDCVHIFHGGQKLIWENYDSFISNDEADMVLRSRIKEDEEKKPKPSNNYSKKHARNSIANLNGERLEHEFQDIPKVKIEELQCMCPLLDYMMTFDDQPIKEYPKFKTIYGLLMSLCKLGKTYTEFQNSFLVYGENKKHPWIDFVKYYKMRNLKPKLCRNMKCPFFEKCPDNSASLFHKISRQQEVSITELKPFDESTLVPIEVAESMLKEEIDKFLDGDVDEHDTAIIKAECSLGKTSVLLEGVIERKHNGKCIPSITIACCGHKKKDEIADKLKENGVEVLVKPELDLKKIPKAYSQIIKRYYNIGDWVAAKERIYKFGEDNEYCRKYIEEYKGFKKKKEKSSVYVTTIEEVLINPDDVHTDLLYFDEDPTFDILQQKEMKFEDIIKLHIDFSDDVDGIGDTILRLTKALKNQCDNNKIISFKNIFSDDDHKELRKRMKENKSISSDFVSFLQSDLFIVYEDLAGNIRIPYIKKRTLPKKKILLGSATISAWMAELLYPDMNFVEIPKAKKKGQVIQCCEYSLSRGSFKRHWNNISEKHKEAIQKMNIITHGSKSYLFNYTKLIFGNAIAVDTLKGEDICVIGTPNFPPSVYRLILAGLEGKTYVNSLDQTIINATVSNKEFIFTARVFKDDDLRAIQVELINGEIIQTIARNRYLREECTTYLYSNFPVYGAKFVSLEEMEELVVGNEELKLAA